MPEKVRARWVGGYAGIIPGSGQVLNQGDEYEINPAEAYGQTLLVNPQNPADVTLIGFGHVAKAEHAAMARPELEALGYRFEEPSRNWQPLEPFDPATFAAAPADLPAEADLSAFYHEPAPAAPAAPAVTPDLEASRADDGTITIVTHLPPPPEDEPKASKAKA